MVALSLKPILGSLWVRNAWQESRAHACSINRLLSRVTRVEERRQLSSLSPQYDGSGLSEVERTVLEPPNRVERVPTNGGRFIRKNSLRGVPTTYEIQKTRRTKIKYSKLWTDVDEEKLWEGWTIEDEACLQATGILLYFCIPLAQTC